MRVNDVTVALAAAVSVAVAEVFPPPGGPFHVSLEHSELVDESRQDPFNSTHARRMMITRFKPVPKKHCKKLCNVPYMTPEVAKVEDEILGPYLEGIVESPGDMLLGLQLEVCCEVQKTAPAKVFPKILFGTGLNTTRSFYFGTVQQIASMGYEIVLMDHPYETDVVQFPNGDLIFGGHIGRDVEDLEDIVFGLEVRTQDVKFVLDTFGIEKTVYIGQSYGGASAAAALLNETRLVAGVNLDGALWGNVQHTGVDRPFLSFGSVGHNSSFESDPSWANFFGAMETNHSQVWNKELSVLDSIHGAYYDFSIIGDVTGLREKSVSFFGKITGERMDKILREYLNDFIQFTLLGGCEGLLSGPSTEFEDVLFIR
ncbi:unnamed protein product [Clonostachys solani]|uniref:1-alkyl-2-acetylglycerophosphocholine esterase n=1 Tax=Clonostachys solani TaxID=160281 RepID=A0A9P0EQS4_9HYPO|nr:unnamed protein product [Clonostachys solani]